MLFGFRGVRGFQLVLALIALAAGVGTAILAKVFVDTSDNLVLIPTFVLGLVFVWMFGAAMRIPTSFVAVSEERTRIRMGGFFDQVVDNRDIVGAKLVNHPIWSGLGVRSTFHHDVAFATTWGPAAQLTLRYPVRVWLIPKLFPYNANRLTVTVRHPARLVERFYTGASSPDEGTPRKMKARGKRR